VVGLAECGTHALTAAAIGAYTTGEPTLTRDLLGALEPGMLVLADRNFYSFELWTEAAATGAQLLWRTKAGHVLRSHQQLPDGSWLAWLRRFSNYLMRGTDVEVRVIDYGIDDPGRPQAEDRYRLITTITEPAAELAALYPQRWEFETTLDELKSHQRGTKVVLRSKQPELARQQIYRYLCVHYAIRWLMHVVALEADTDPDRLSFTRTLRAARRTAGSHPGFPPRTLTDAHARARQEMLAELLPARRLRAAPRVVKRKMSNYAVKRAEYRTRPQPARRPEDAVVVLTS